MFYIHIYFHVYISTILLRCYGIEANITPPLNNFIIPINILQISKCFLFSGM